MSEQTEVNDVPTPDAPYGYKADGTKRQKAPPGWRKRFPVETRIAEPGELARRPRRSVSAPAGLRAAPVVLTRLSEEERAAMSNWQPSVYDYAELISEGYDPEHSLHFATATEEDIEAAYRLIKKLGM